MESIVKVDLFFLVTTIAIVLVSGTLIVALVYIIKILRDIRHLSRSVKEEGDKIIEDVELVRKGFVSKVIGFLNPLQKTRKKAKKD